MPCQPEPSGGVWTESVLVSSADTSAWMGGREDLRSGLWTDWDHSRDHNEDAICDVLVDAAHTAGGSDDISAILAGVQTGCDT